MIIGIYYYGKDKDSIMQASITENPTMSVGTFFNETRII